MSDRVKIDERDAARIKKLSSKMASLQDMMAREGEEQGFIVAKYVDDPRKVLRFDFDNSELILAPEESRQDG